MSDTYTKDLGAVTAYADAKAHGYTGTREEFGQLLALAAAAAPKAALPRQPSMPPPTWTAPSCPFIPPILWRLSPGTPSRAIRVKAVP